MKRIAFFIIALAISLSINAQDYQKLWDEYNDNMENFLPESASKVLDKIESQAFNDKNDVQLLKTAIKRCEVFIMKEEDPDDTILGFCKYYRTMLSEESRVLLETEIAKNTYDYENLLPYQDNDFIKTISMEKFADLFPNDNDRIVFDINLEPTLYDYVMHCLVSNYKYYSIEDSLYAKLLDFDLKNNYIKAYYNTKMMRIGDIYNESDYEKYSQLAEECTDNEYLAKIKIKQIEYLSFINIDKTKIEQPYVKAKQLCDEVLQLLDKKHPLYNQCVEFVKSLTHKHIDLKMNNVCVPNKTIAVGLTYRNTTNVSYKIYKVSSADFRKLQRLENEELGNTLLKRKATIENTVTTTEESDYDQHSSLIALPALKSGQYYLVFSNCESFKNIKDLVFAPFQVSELSYFTLDTDKNKNVYVVNRETGAPASNVTAHFLAREYSYKNKDYQYKFLGDAVSDTKGLLTVPVDNEQTYFFIDLYTASDTLLASSQENIHKNAKNNIVNKTWLYTDRAIYRPGQTVQFRGLTLRKSARQCEIVPDYEVLVRLYDPNHQLIDTVRVKSNDFGAFSGSFVIPNDRLRGKYSIKHDKDIITFKVEDYKRPTFEVTFNTPEKEYRVGDSVQVTGKVAALSGFGLDNVKYKYTVTRKTLFPFRYYGWSPYHQENEIIISDSKVTSIDGGFSIDFNLNPSKYVSNSNIPYYIYEITVEATSKQGETQTGTYSVFATYNKYSICLEHNGEEITDIESIDIQNLKEYNVKTTNISGNPTNTKVLCNIFKYNDLEKYEQDLGSFDRKILSDQLLKAYFPHYDYYSKQNITKDLVYQKVIDIKGKAALLAANETLKPGKYLIELKAVDDSLSVYYDDCTVFDVKTKKMPYKSICWTSIDKNSAKPGETINYHVGSSENVSALVIVKLGKTIIKTERIQLNNSIYKLSYKVREQDRGQLDFQVALEKYNMEGRHIDYVEVPYDNMDLSLTLNTTRQVLNPGESQTWSVTARDYKNNPVSASLMAVMYDAALDNFASLNWDLRTKPTQLASSTIMSDKSFGTLTKYQPFELSRFYYETNMMFSSAYLIHTNNYYRDDKLRFSFSSDQFYKALEVEMEDMAADNMYYTVDDKDGNAQQTPAAKIRKNFNETAFFFPDLRTDENGNATFSFTMPDALTRWNLKLITYSKTLSVGKLDKSFVTQQPLMITTDMPRFVYDEDTLWLTANVMNMTDDDATATAKLEIFDNTGKQLSLLLTDADVIIDNPIPANSSRAVRWKAAMKKDLNLLTCRFSVITDGYTDAEEHRLPVLSTDIFMTQTFALTTKANTTQDFEFNTKNEGERNHDIRLNFNANPLYYAIQALPYIADNDEKYITTAFNRFFTNKMAKQILEENPKIKEMLTDKGDDNRSELEKDEDLKAIMLQATPWIREAESEAEQRANIAKLFDTEEINKNIWSALSELATKQTVNGGWAWINGMPESEYITQYILCGLGRLGLNNKITEEAFYFLENQIVEQYKKLDTQKKKKNASCDFTTMRELFAMSCFSYKTSKDFNEARDFYTEKLCKEWKHFTPEEQAYIALILNKKGNKEIVKVIIKSLRERAIKNESGMYWRNISVESEARILEAFNAIDPNTEELDAMRLWILSQKRTNMWENDRSTVEAIFALMNRGSDWNNDDATATMQTNDDNVKVVVENNTNHVVWGGLFRQYFVPIDNIQKHNDAMKLKRELFVERIIGDKKQYVPIAGEDINIGDKIKVEITFENGQDMEFVFLKDLRGACFEPTEQLSRYSYEDGLCYYQSTTDVSMEYFFDYVPKGKHTVSHTIYVTKDGSFSAGYSQIQCQYATEFGAYSNGMRIKVN